jgi:hypothetical protein
MEQHPGHDGGWNEPLPRMLRLSEEIVAELAATALYQIVTEKPDKGLANSYSFILLNSVALGKTAIESCLELFAETEEIIEFILA